MVLPISLYAIGVPMVQPVASIDNAPFEARGSRVAATQLAPLNEAHYELMYPSDNVPQFCVDHHPLGRSVMFNSTCQRFGNSTPHIMYMHVEKSKHSRSHPWVDVPLF